MYNDFQLKQIVPWERTEEMVDVASIMNEAIASGVINMAYVREEIEMKKRKEILDSHKYRIGQSKTDGKWYTYLPDEQKGRVKRKRNTREELENVVIQHYKQLEKQQKCEEYGFRNCWNEWKNKKISYGVSANTVQKYDSDYLRFFANTDFEKKDIRNISEEDITAFIIQRIQELDLKDKAGKSLWGQMAGVFETARIRRKIKEDPCLYVDTKLFNKFYNKSCKAVEERILSGEEKVLLMQQIHRDHEKNPGNIQSYAIELAMYTGMRVGELAALRWSNVLFNEGVIIISESEKHNRATKENIISSTKTGKIRHFPMTEEIVDFFKTLKKVQMQQGIMGEFVFTNKNGKVTAHSISDYMRRKCDQAGIKQCGVHTLRRTLNSQMRCNGVSATVAAALLGHTEEVNEMNYTYDITGMEYKREVVRKAIG